MKKFVFATNNAHKLEEVRDILGDKIELLSLKDINCHEEIPETADTLAGNALLKARYVYDKYHLNCFADDTGLEVEALNGAPGLYSARYADTPQARINKLLKELEPHKNRNAKFVCAMTLVDENGEIIFQTTGECQGKIAYKQAGTGGFGYDPVFLVENTPKTMAEMSEEEKNEISHRGRALRKVIEFLTK